MMTAANQVTALYLRQQAYRCQRLSRDCMDLTTARDLRLVAEEFFAEAMAMEKSQDAAN
jgi:hypothetical protein